MGSQSVREQRCCTFTSPHRDSRVSWQNLRAGSRQLMILTGSSVTTHPNLPDSPWFYMLEGPGPGKVSQTPKATRLQLGLLLPSTDSSTRYIAMWRVPHWWGAKCRTINACTPPDCAGRGALDSFWEKELSYKTPGGMDVPRRMLEGWIQLFPVG